MNRRRMLKLAGASVGALAVGAAGRYWLLPPSRSRELASADELARRLFAGLDGEARGRACVPYDHPLR